MMHRHSTFLFFVMTVVLGLLGFCELSLRFSSSFNEFVYVHTTPRNSDDFRIWYRLRRANAEAPKPSVAFIGTSTTRDGVDVRLFATEYPDNNFFNLGGIYKMPEHELQFVDDYASAGIDYLVYWISGSDIFKFRGSGSAFHSDYFPGLERYLDIFDRPSLIRLSQAYQTFWRDFFAHLFLTYRFREVLAEAFENAALSVVGISLPGDFDFFWQQQSFDDPELIAHKLRYIERSDGFFERKLEASLVSLRKLAQRTRAHGIQLLFLYSNGVCDTYRKSFAPHILQAEEDLVRGLRQMAEGNAHIRFERLAPFNCDQYAELFHLNSLGREEFFKKVSPLLDPYLRQTP